VCSFFSCKTVSFAQGRKVLFFLAAEKNSHLETFSTVFPSKVVTAKKLVLHAEEVRCIKAFPKP